MHNAKWTCIQNCSEVVQLNTGKPARPETHWIHYKFDFKLFCCHCTFREPVMSRSVYCGGSVAIVMGQWTVQSFNTQNCWAVTIPSRDRRAEQRITWPVSPAGSPLQAEVCFRRPMSWDVFIMGDTDGIYLLKLVHWAVAWVEGEDGILVMGFLRQLSWHPKGRTSKEQNSQSWEFQQYDSRSSQRQVTEERMPDQSRAHWWTG